MNKKFNTDGYCDPKIHYMVDLSSRLAEIKSMVDDGKYFTINKARQYKISDFQTDVYYQNPSYLECSYEAGYLLD